MQNAKCKCKYQKMKNTKMQNANINYKNTKCKIQNTKCKLFTSAVAACVAGWTVVPILFAHLLTVPEK